MMHIAMSNANNNTKLQNKKFDSNIIEMHDDGCSMQQDAAHHLCVLLSYTYGTDFLRIPVVDSQRTSCKLSVELNPIMKCPDETSGTYYVQGNIFAGLTQLYKYIYRKWMTRRSRTFVTSELIFV